MAKVLNYLGMHRDITEVHRLEYQVRNQKALIESVVDAAPVVIALLDVDDRVVLDNHEYKMLQADLGMAEPAPMLMSADPCRVSNSNRAVDDAPRATFFSIAKCGIDPPGGKQPRWFSCSGSRVREDASMADAFLAGQPSRLPAAGCEGDYQPARAAGKGPCRRSAGSDGR
jgi:hypothetical protein